MHKPRRLRINRNQRKLRAAVVFGINFDWINERNSKPRLRVKRLLRLLQRADLLSENLLSQGASLPATTNDGAELLSVLRRADTILKRHRGTRTIWVHQDYRLVEMFCDLKNPERDDPEARLTNFILEILRDGWIQQFRICKECQRWYYAKAGHQVFCTLKCRQLFASRGLRFKARRREYMKHYRIAEMDRTNRSKQAARSIK